MKSLRMQKEIRKLKKAVRKEPVQIEGYEIESHLADGHAGSIFRARRSDEDYVLKIMAPSLIPGKLMYAFFLQGKHGYFDANAVDAAYWKRRFVSRFVKTLDDEIEILDLTEQSQRFNGCGLVRNGKRGKRKNR